METFRQIYVKFRQSFSDNPHIVVEIESALKYLSYLLAGRFHHSAVWSEFANLVSNLLKLSTHEILHSNYSRSSYIDKSEQIQKWLRVVQQVQVFLEISTGALGGDPVRWFVIFLVEVVKVVLKIILLLKYKRQLQLASEITDLDRNCENVESASDDLEKDVHTENGRVESKNIVLKRSGRTMRSIFSAQSSSCRHWRTEPVIEDGTSIRNESSHCKRVELDDVTIRGEILHLLRPVVHLGTMFFFSIASWRPFVISLVMDVVSLQILSKKKNLMNKDERSELDRRRVLLLMYSLRSPFYDKVSKAMFLAAVKSLYESPNVCVRINGVKSDYFRVCISLRQGKKIIFTLRKLANKIPFFGIVINPVIEYLPEWQRTYFYTWDQ